MSRLLSPAGETVLIVDFYCYIDPLEDDRLLIWYEAGRSESESDNPRVEFVILNLLDLQTIGDADALALDVRERNQRIRFYGGNPTVFACSTAHNAGSFAIESPEEFRELGEILVLADFGPPGVASNHFDVMRRAILCFDFPANQVTVMPQEWFNKGSYDFGYQWITRVQRDPQTRQIFGEGIRLGSFRLDASGTNIDEWVRHDAFFHPEF